MKTLGGNVLGTFLRKVLFMFSERLCGTIPHNHHVTFTEHLLPEYPILRLLMVFKKSTLFMAKKPQKYYNDLSSLGLEPLTSEI